MSARLHFNRFEEWSAAREALPAARRAAREALGRGDARADGKGDGEEARPGEVSFTCLSADEIAEMNRRYLERDGPTDVIAFSLSGPGGELSGDVYLSPPVAARSADERGIGPAEEIVRLVVHGALHVLGHEHPGGPERETSEMYRLQEELVDRALGSSREAGEGT